MKIVRVIALLAAVVFAGCGTAPPTDDDHPDLSDDDAADDDSHVPDDDAADDDAVGDDDTTGQPDDDTGTPADDDDVPHPLADVGLFINAGDSLAAGYNATGTNDIGGRGYARLLVDNHASWPAYDEVTLSAVAGGVTFHDASESGAQSGEILDDLRDALDDDLPASVNGDVLLVISAGGNDFNDSVWTMVTPALASAAADTLASNLTQMISEVRARYEDPAAGHEVIVVLFTIHDPTGGTCSIPAQFDEGFCETLQNPYFQAAGFLVMDNLGLMNQAVSDTAAASGALVADLHQVFFDHGMNAAGSDRWLDDDCAHPNDTGHHQVRREVWGVITGQWY